MYSRILVLTFLTSLYVGCGRKNPVNEISVTDSGITIAVNRQLEALSSDEDLSRFIL